MCVRRRNELPTRFAEACRRPRSMFLRILIVLGTIAVAATPWLLGIKTKRPARPFVGSSAVPATSSSRRPLSRT